MKRLLVAFVVALALLLAVVAYAQMNQPPNPPPGPGPMAPPPVTMLADDDSLFILRGNYLVKVSKASLEVVAEKMLPMPKPPQPPQP